MSASTIRFKFVAANLGDSSLPRRGLGLYPYTVPLGHSYHTSMPGPDAITIRVIPVMGSSRREDIDYEAAPVDVDRFNGLEVGSEHR